MGLISRVSSRTYRGSLLYSGQFYRIFLLLIFSFKMDFYYSPENKGICYLYTSQSECFLHCVDASNHQTISRMFLFADNYRSALNDVIFLCKEYGVTELEVKILSRREMNFRNSQHFGVDQRFDPDTAINMLNNNGIVIRKIENKNESFPSKIAYGPIVSDGDRRTIKRSYRRR